MSYFTKQKLLTMLQLQAEANNVMSDAWLTSKNGCPSEGGISYYRAAALEAGEAIGHLGFKWWKKEDSDNEQTNLELIDMLHFALSEFYRRCQTSLESSVESILGNLELSGFSNSIEHKRLALEEFIAECYASKYVSLYRTIELCYRFGLTENYVYNMYVGKNVLNKFRTSNGQRRNTYIKKWHGKEDNVYLEQYLTNLNGELINPVELEKYLFNCYSKVLQNG